MRLIIIGTRDERDVAALKFGVMINSTLDEKLKYLEANTDGAVYMTAGEAMKRLYEFPTDTLTVFTSGVVEKFGIRHSLLNSMAARINNPSGSVKAPPVDTLPVQAGLAPRRWFVDHRKSDGMWAAMFPGHPDSPMVFDNHIQAGWVVMERNARLDAEAAEFQRKSCAASAADAAAAVNDKYGGPYIGNRKGD